MQHSQTLHLVYGPVAAGKSTYARKLSAEVNAIRFAIDEWMHALFEADRPDKLDMAWIVPRVGRCRTMIWSMCSQVLASGRDVVLEIGLMRETERAAMKSLVDESGHGCAFHFVDAPRNVRLTRTLQRNHEKGPTYSFDVTPAMFEAMELHFERPTQREMGHTMTVTPNAHA